MTASRIDTRAVSDALVRELLRSGHLPDEAAMSLLEAAAAPPSTTQWRALLARLLTFAGAALVLSGVVFFIAFNWAALGRLAKFGLVQLAIVVAIVVALRRGERLSGQAALLAAAVLVGPLLALYGQTYQTGADPFELFVGWALLILPWVALSRMPALWLLLLLLANTGYLLYWTQILAGEAIHDERLPLYFFLLFAINAGPWALWELFSQRGVSWLRVRWLPRVVATMACGVLVTWLCILIFNELELATGWIVASVIITAGALASIVRFFRGAQPDLFMLALAAAAAMVAISCAAARVLFKELDADIGGTFLLGVLVIAQVAATATWLRFEGRRFDALAEPAQEPPR